MSESNQYVVINDDNPDPDLFEVFDVRYTDIHQINQVPEDNISDGYVVVQLKGRSLMLDRMGISDIADASEVVPGDVEQEAPTYKFDDCAYVSWGELLQLLDQMRTANKLAKLN